MAISFGFNPFSQSVLFLAALAVVAGEATIRFPRFGKVFMSAYLLSLAAVAFLGSAAPLEVPNVRQDW